MGESCSVLASRSAEPLAGTAEPVQCWLMLEFRGEWKALALEDNNLPDGIKTWMTAGVDALRSMGLKTRPQLIRQQQIRNKDHLSLFVGLTGQVEPRLYEFKAASYAEFTCIDLSCLVENPATYADQQITDHRYFVCTNSRRDACCGVYGMRVYAQLAGACGSAAWQTTHLGGHRFAATLISLPAGILYGRLRPTDVDGLLQAHAAGRMVLPKLRGRSALDAASQVAEIALRERTGQLELDRYNLLEAYSLEGIEHRVFEDRIDGGRHEIRLRPGAEPLFFRAGCNDQTLKHRQVYEALPQDNPG